MTKIELDRYIKQYKQEQLEKFLKENDWILSRDELPKNVRGHGASHMVLITDNGHDFKVTCYLWYRNSWPEWINPPLAWKPMF